MMNYINKTRRTTEMAPDERRRNGWGRMGMRRKDSGTEEP